MQNNISCRELSHRNCYSSPPPSPHFQFKCQLQILECVFPCTHSSLQQLNHNHQTRKMHQETHIGVQKAALQDGAFVCLLLWNEEQHFTETSKAQHRSDLFLASCLQFPVLPEGRIQKLEFFFPKVSHWIVYSLPTNRTSIQDSNLPPPFCVTASRKKKFTDPPCLKAGSRSALSYTQMEGQEESEQTQDVSLFLPVILPNT